MRAILVGHSQGGIQVVKILHELAGSFGDKLRIFNPLTGEFEERTTIVDPLTGRERGALDRRFLAPCRRSSTCSRLAIPPFLLSRWLAPRPIDAER